MKLLRHPEWAGLQKGAKTTGGNAEVGLQDPFEFEKWLVVETDELDRAVIVVAPSAEYAVVSLPSR